MSTKYYYEQPTTSDKIKFVIDTPNDNGELVDPYSIQHVTIFFAERTPGGLYEGIDERQLESSIAGAEVSAYQQIYTDNPTTENKQQYEAALARAALADQNITDYFREAIPVEVIGSDISPAWLDPSQVPPMEADQVAENNILQHISTSSFELEWSRTDLRDGDYYICWEYYPEPAGESLSKSIKFRILPDAKLTTPIPTQLTSPDKYPILFDRYIPHRFKQQMIDGDETYEVLQAMTGIYGSLLRSIEDQANGLIGLYDPNVITEQFIPVVARMLGVKLTSNDPVLWRRQIARAIPLAKKKGTLGGLREAMSLSGNTLLDLSWFWQVASKYTYQEAILIENSLTEINLSYTISLPLNTDNFELYHLPHDSDVWTELDETYVSVSNIGGHGLLTWLGSSHTTPINLSIGDYVRVVYERHPVPSGEQDVETYIRSLPLLDQRPGPIELPPKNWNLRGIREDDPLFSLIVTERHPHHDPIVFGMIRTEFPYSENVYNAEEWNGSTRTSTNPCHIDGNFIDSCTACRSSSYAIDIEIPEYHEYVISDIKDILYDFMPFHSDPLEINFHVQHELLVPPPIFETESIFHITNETNMIYSSNGAFYRSIPMNIASNMLQRDMLATSEIIASGVSGTLQVENLVLVSPGDGLSGEGEPSVFEAINTSNVDSTVLDSSNLVVVRSPHVNAGLYTISTIQNGVSSLVYEHTVPEPVSTSQFTFDVSNKTINISGVAINPSNVVCIASSALREIAHELDGTYTISVTGYDDYSVGDVMPDGSIRVITSDFPTTDTSVTFSVLDANLDTILSTTGVVKTTQKSILDLSYTVQSPYDDIRNYVKAGDVAKINGVDYPIIDFVAGEVDEIVIGDYDLGAAAGVTVDIYRPIIKRGIGQLGYENLVLSTSTNYETSLNLRDGESETYDESSDNYSKREFLILISGELYSIAKIDGTLIYLEGPPLSSIVLSQNVTFSIIKYTKEDITIPERTHPDIPETTHEKIDRSGSDDIQSETETFMSLMSLKEGSSSTGNVIETDFDIQFTIEYDDGKTENGNIKNEE